MRSIKWAADFCSVAKFVMKVDDDMLINSYPLINYLDNLISTGRVQANTFYCKPLIDGKVIRDKFSKYYVSKNDYHNDTFHKYCQGMVYIFSGSMASQLSEQSLTTKYLPMEDLYVGLLGLKLNFKFINVWENFYYEWYKKNDIKNGFSSFEINHFDDKFFIFVKEKVDIIPIWNILLKRFYKSKFDYSFIN